MSLKTGLFVIAVAAAAVVSVVATGAPLDHILTDLSWAGGRLAGLVLWIGIPAWFVWFGSMFARHVPSSAPALPRQESRPRPDPTRITMIGAAGASFSLAVIAPMIAAPFFDPEFVGQYPVTLRQVCTLLVIAGAFMLAGAAVSGRSRLAAQAAFVAAVTPLIFGWAFSALPFLSLFAFAGVGMTLRAFITNLVTFEVTKLAELALPAAGVILPFIYIAILAWTARTAWRAGS